VNHSLSSLAASISCVALLSACIPIPLVNPPPYRSETIGTLERGTPRADVLFTLGAPNFVHEDERVFVYASDEEKMGYIFVLGAETAGAVGAGTVAQRFLLVIEFDHCGRIQRTDVLDLGLGIGDDGDLEIGYDDTVCTSWNLCFTRSGALLVSEAESVDPSVETQCSRSTTRTIL